MKKTEVFELLNKFKKTAKNESDLYDVYKGEVEPIVLWIIYNGKEKDSLFVSSIRFENMDSESEYIVEIMVGENSYQFFNFLAACGLINSIQY